MVKLNDYLYNGDTVFKIIQRYAEDLENSAMDTNNQIDILHCNFLSTISDILEHNEFLTSQSNRIRGFYNLMVKDYPYLAFTFKGRIKSLIRAEEKFNRYLVDYNYEYFKEFGRFPEVAQMKHQLSCFRDLIAYRIVISLPKCHIKAGQDGAEEERRILYEIANKLPHFLEDNGFTLIKADSYGRDRSSLLDEEVKEYYRDYVYKPSKSGYQSLHLTVYDNVARCYIEMQLRTKSMDDYAEIGPANHLGYEKQQKQDAARRKELPEGVCRYFDEAYDRVVSLEKLDLSKVDVNMFAAMSNTLVNDGCGLFRGRQILPFEHLSRFQNDL